MPVPIFRNDAIMALGNQPLRKGVYLFLAGIFKALLYLNAGNVGIFDRCVKLEGNFRSVLRWRFSVAPWLDEDAISMAVRLSRWLCGFCVHWAVGHTGRHLP